MKKNVNLAALKKFLAETISQTYATGQGKVAKPQRPEFIEYSYKKGDFFYRDSYQGGAISWGQENVFYKGKPVWSLIYGGGIPVEFRKNKTLEKETFACMKEALKLSRQGKEFLPRGPRCLVYGKFTYICEWEGDLEWFRGQEKVFYKDKLVHVYDFAGGMYVE